MQTRAPFVEQATPSEPELGVAVPVEGAAAGGVHSVVTRVGRRGARSAEFALELALRALVWRVVGIVVGLVGAGVGA
jgi:hypothetical protein